MTDIEKLRRIHPYPLPPESSMSIRPACLRCGHPLSGQIIRGVLGCEICQAVNHLNPNMTVAYAVLTPEVGRDAR